MVKVFISFMMAATLLFAPVSFMGQDNVTVVDAKSYRSGVKSFNKSKTPPTSSFKKEQINNYSKKTTTSSKSGLMKGLLFGGLAGLLFGSLLSQLGGLGSLLGLLINVIVIYFIIKLVFKVLTYFVRKNRERNADIWRR